MPAIKLIFKTLCMELGALFSGVDGCSSAQRKEEVRLVHYVPFVYQDDVVKDARVMDSGFAGHGESIGVCLNVEPDP
jgi:hypothetical protein